MMQNSSYDFDNIVKKHNYDKEFSEFLKEVYLELVEYFQDETLVYNALFDTKVIRVMNCYDYLKSNNLLDQNNYLLSEDDMKRSAGLFHSLPIISYDKNTKCYKIDNVKRMVLLSGYSLHDFAKGTLIHELSHLIKSYYNEYAIEDDILIEYCGLQVRKYKLSFENNEVKTSLISEMGVGLEEGLTEVCEVDIAKKMHNPEYIYDTYDAVHTIAANLIKDNDLFNLIIKTELYHDNTELLNSLKDTYYKLLEFTDRIYALILKSETKDHDKEKRKEIYKIINELLNTEYPQILEEINNRKRN